MNKTRTVTTVFEYDENGKVVKETRTEYEYEWQPAPVYNPGWWQTPVYPYTVTCGSASSSGTVTSGFVATNAVLS